MIDLSEFDFVDFGCSVGGSMKFAERAFAGGRAVGIDIDPSKVERTRAAGYEAVLADATDPHQFRGQARFSILSHFLEHLPNYEAVARSVETAIAISRDFVFVRQPWFDTDGELFRHGLKFYWSDWSGHPMPLTSLQMHRAIRKALDSGRIARATIYGFTPVVDTDDECVIPVSAPLNSSKYDPALHEPKINPAMKLDAFRELVVVLAKRDQQLTETLLGRFPGIVTLHDELSEGGSPPSQEQSADVEDPAAQQALTGACSPDGP
ncbi:MAG TPA: methyltransferase domain-containing protein [Sphingomicrobium sp.]|nr:methyltransferase domain-containing protein [Sphingomicrobium sp.]